MADTLPCTLGHFHINEGVMYLHPCHTTWSRLGNNCDPCDFFDLLFVTLGILALEPRDRGSVIWSFPCLKNQLGAAVLSKMLCSPPDCKLYKVWGYEFTESLLPYHPASPTAFWPSPLMSMAFHPENSRLRITFIKGLVFRAYSHCSRHGLSHAPALLWSISTCL